MEELTLAQRDFLKALTELLTHYGATIQGQDIKIFIDNTSVYVNYASQNTLYVTKQLSLDPRKL